MRIFQTCKPLIADSTCQAQGALGALCHTQLHQQHIICTKHAAGHSNHCQTIGMATEKDDSWMQQLQTRNKPLTGKRFRQWRPAPAVPLTCSCNKPQPSKVNPRTFGLSRHDCGIKGNIPSLFRFIGQLINSRSIWPENAPAHKTFWCSRKI